MQCLLWQTERRTDPLALNKLSLHKSKLWWVTNAHWPSPKKALDRWTRCLKKRFNKSPRKMVRFVFTAKVFIFVVVVVAGVVIVVIVSLAEVVVVVVIVFDVATKVIIVFVMVVVVDVVVVGRRPKAKDPRNYLSCCCSLRCWCCWCRRCSCCYSLRCWCRRCSCCRRRCRRESWPAAELQITVHFSVTLSHFLFLSLTESSRSLTTWALLCLQNL